MGLTIVIAITITPVFGRYMVSILHIIRQMNIFQRKAEGSSSLRQD